MEHQQQKMPITNINSSLEKGPGGGGRTTFRPPWVKESNAPTIPWSKRNSTAGAPSADASKENGTAATEKKEVKLQSKEIKVPVTTITAKKTTPTAAKSAKDPIKEPVIKKEEEKKTTGRTIPIEVKKESPATGALGEKPGKFVRPVLKKVAKVDATPAPPVVLEKAVLKETPKVAASAGAKKTQPIVSKLKPTQKEESEEEETSSEEEETEEEEEETDEEEETEEEESEEEASTTVSSASKGESKY